MATFLDLHGVLDKAGSQSVFERMFKSTQFHLISYCNMAIVFKYNALY